MTSNEIERLPSGGRVFVIRLRALGDCVLSTPSLRLLKQHRPDLRIAIVSESRLHGVFEGNPDLDAVLPPTVAAVRSFRPNLCINFHGGMRSARLTLLSGASRRAAWDCLRFRRIYNVHIPTAQRILDAARPVHTAEHMASAMFYLGVPPSEVPRARIFPQQGRLAAAPSSAYAVIHPAASHADKTWPADSFACVASQLGLEPIFIGGPEDNLSFFAKWRVMKGLTLADVARLIRDAELFIGNDSGPAHLAAAVGTPQVVLFGPSNAVTWAPWRAAAAEVLQARGSMETISVDDVLRAAARVRLVTQ